MITIGLVLLIAKLAAALGAVLIAFWKAGKIRDAHQRKLATEKAFLGLLATIPDLWLAVEQEKRRDPAGIAAQAPLSRALSLADEVTGGWLKTDPAAWRLVEVKLRAHHEKFRDVALRK